MASAIWPEWLQPATCKWGRSRNDAAQVSPVSRKRKIIRRGRPLWTAEITWRLPPWSVGEARLYLDELSGSAGSIFLRDYAASRVSVTNTIQVNANVASGATSVATKGWPASTANLVRAGQYVSIDGGLYVISADASSNGSGVLTMVLKTPLIQAALADALVLVNTPYCLMRLTSQDWSGSRSADDALLTVTTSWIERAGGGGNVDGEAIILLDEV